MNDITPTALQQRLASGEKLILIDVREPHEHEEYNLGGLNIPITELPFRIEEVKQAGDGDIILYCQSGNRSVLAQKLLDMQFRIHHTLNLRGGITAWMQENPSADSENVRT